MQIFMKKLSESFLQVYSDDYGIMEEINDHFKFFVSGARFMPKFKAKIWDGFAHLYNIREKQLPCGLLSHLIKFCEVNKYDLIGADDVIPPGEKITSPQLHKFIQKLNLHSGGKAITPRDYQIKSCELALQKERLILQSPTASGKSLVLYILMRYFLLRNKRCVIIVPTTSLVEQLYTDFEDYSSGNKWDVESNCHRLYSGKTRDFEKPVLISTWQTIHSMSSGAAARQPATSQFFLSWDVLIGDECHKFQSSALMEITKKLTNSRYRIGTTGTVQDDKVSKLQLEGTFGPIHKVISTRELIDKNQVSDLSIKCILLKHHNIPETYDRAIRGDKKKDYFTELMYLVTNEKRNTFVSNLIRVCRGNTLVLFQLVEAHGLPLYQMISDQLGDSRKIFYISGSTPVDERESIRKSLNEYKDAVVVASVAILSTGVNIPSIENIIFASPTKSKIRNLQSIGRGLRLNPGKTKCNLFDIGDDLTYRPFGKNRKTNYTMSHFKDRIELYGKEEFDFDIRTYKIE